jgi:gas vesicle protein
MDSAKVAAVLPDRDVHNPNKNAHWPNAERRMPSALSAFQSCTIHASANPEREAASVRRRPLVRIQKPRKIQLEDLCMKGFLIGLGVGVGLGVLFAPMSGEETRNNLVDRASDLSDSARELVDQGKERVRSGISTVRSQAENVIGRTQKATGTEGNV